ncbi:MAG: hypothetical protein RDV48_09685 [Candidatus Eremiobacteraeota bacterium]|nr:hypothetical protein [Candidatus Eremiobacteraeota bacterium]
MAKTEKKVIGIMDPNYFSFVATLEHLIKFCAPRLEHNGTEYEVATKRMKCRPYDTLNAWTETCVIMNRGAHWNHHRNSFFSIVGWKAHLIYNMFSFKAIDKNAGYGMMHELGLKVPTTWAIPQKDYTKLREESTTVNMQFDLIFEDHELFDLEKIGEAVGYPAFLKPQAGGGWVGVKKVNNYQELKEAYDKSEDKPVNLQKAVDYKEFVRSVGIGPQIMPMHYNADAKHSHDRYMRTATQAVEFNFITPEEEREINKITKIINAFYGWDHNSCESLITAEGDNFIIDYINAYPDSSLISLHFYFPGVVKAMAKWLLFCAVVGRPEGYDFMRNWPRFYKIREESRKKNWDYFRLLDEYEKVADDYWETEKFNDFCAHQLADFDEKALEFFSSAEFNAIIAEDVERYFKIPEERPEKYSHYRGILDFWVHCERDKIGMNKKGVRPPQVEKAEKVEKAVKVEKPVKVEKTVKAEKPVRIDKAAAPKVHGKVEKREAVGAGRRKK